MAKIDLETITEPLSEEQPCGPDLDMEFDMDFMNFSAEIEGVIPTRYFGWDPATLKFQQYYDVIGDFLERTRDIRLLVPLAKLRVLQSDLAGFAETLEAIHRLLRDRWSDVHPQPSEFLEISMGQLATLDDMPNVVLPLQHATLVRSRRAGAITLRKWQIAHGEVNPREGEEKIDAETLSAGIAEAEAEEVTRSLDALKQARDAVAGIRTVCMQEAGFEKAPPFDRLPQSLDAAIEMLRAASGGDAEAGGDAPADGEAADGGAGTVVVRLPAGAVASREEAVAAMHVAARYFALQEPSSPVPLLLREAEAAASKSFYELVNDLVPDAAGSAFVSLGREPWFDIYLSTLDARNPAPDYAAEDQEEIAAENTGLGDDEVAGESAGNDVPDDGAEDDAGEEGNSGDEAAAEAEGAAEGAGGGGETGASGGESGADETAAEAADDGAADESGAGDDVAGEIVAKPAVPRPKFVANSRPEAVALLEKVVAYYRVAEPTSPVPLLVERAIELSSKSFIELLGKVLPEGSLRVRSE